MTGIGPERLRELVASLGHRRVLVIGDFMIDRYVWGGADRISPEGPVPVVVVDHDSTMLGGAGNVARNLASLGAEVHVIGIVGEDVAAREMRRLLERWKIVSEGLIVDPERPTTEKTRVIARSQQIVRYDRESQSPISSEMEERVLAAVSAIAGRVEGVIVEDYAKGMLTAQVLSGAMKAFGRHGLRVFVDPKAEPWDFYRGAELVKPNLPEAAHLARMRVESSDDLASVGRLVLHHTGAENVAITRGPEGMDLFSADGGRAHFPVVARVVSDLAGAGDTTIAVLALARLSGATWAESAQLANAAAGCVVGLPGTATVTPVELLQAMGIGS